MHYIITLSHHGDDKCIDTIFTKGECNSTLGPEPGDPGPRDPCLSRKKQISLKMDGTERVKRHSKQGLTHSKLFNLTGYFFPT